MTIVLFFLFFFVAFGLMATFKFIMATTSLAAALGIMWYHTVPCAVAIAAFPFVWRYLRAVRARLHFVSRLKRICRKNKLKCKFKTPSLLSIFQRYRRSDIRVEVGETVYSIKYFYGNVVKRFVHLQTPENAESSKYFVMPAMVCRNQNGLAMQILHKFAMMRGKFFINEMEYGRKQIESEIDFEEGAVPILLISPAPMRITGVVGNTAKQLGSGEEFQGVVIYEDEGFLGFLSRAGA